MMASKEQIAKFELEYAVRFADAADRVVIMMYGLAFSVYWLASLNDTIKKVLYDRFEIFLIVAILGNLSLLVLITRMWAHEWHLIAKVYEYKDWNLATLDAKSNESDKSPRWNIFSARYSYWNPFLAAQLYRTTNNFSEKSRALFNSSNSAFKMRYYLFMFNFGLYITFLILLRIYN